MQISLITGWRYIVRRIMWIWYSRCLHTRCRISWLDREDRVAIYSNHIDNIFAVSLSLTEIKVKKFWQYFVRDSLRLKKLSRCWPADNFKKASLKVKVLQQIPITFGLGTVYVLRVWYELALKLPQEISPQLSKYLGFHCFFFQCRSNGCQSDSRIM